MLIVRPAWNPGAGENPDFSGEFIAEKPRPRGKVGGGNKDGVMWPAGVVLEEYGYSTEKSQLRNSHELREIKCHSLSDT